MAVTSPTDLPCYLEEPHAPHDCCAVEGAEPHLHCPGVPERETPSERIERTWEEYGHAASAALDALHAGAVPGTAYDAGRDAYQRGRARWRAEHPKEAVERGCDCLRVEHPEVRP
ncbi:MAG: hypothetical protein ACYDDZ_06575 [Acidimicrobiales bacterium]